MLERPRLNCSRRVDGLRRVRKTGFATTDEGAELVEKELGGVAADC
jgi:hypothetical protein